MPLFTSQKGTDFGVLSVIYASVSINHTAYAPVKISERAAWANILVASACGAKPPSRRIVLNLNLVQIMLDEAALRTLYACIQISCAAATICTEIGLEDRSSLGRSMRARPWEATGQPPPSRHPRCASAVGVETGCVFIRTELMQARRKIFGQIDGGCPVTSGDYRRFV
jgi:hypothetical protein